MPLLKFNVALNASYPLPMQLDRTQVEEPVRRKERLDTNNEPQLALKIY